MYEPFVLSSFDQNIAHQLHGYAFRDADLILGQDGYRAFKRERDRNIDPGEDGSYIVAIPGSRETIIGTDFAGYKKMFLYRCGAKWAASDSFLDLARFARARGLPITVSRAHLSTFMFPGPFGVQIATLQTPIEEIELVPANREVVFRDDGRHEIRPTAAATHALPSSYEEGMAEFLTTWVGRAATLLQSDLVVKCDVSGGRDSRAVISLLVAASKLGAGSLKDVVLLSSTSKKDDFAVATRIAERLGGTLNAPTRHLPSPRYDDEQSYQAWKSLSLGVYMPPYFPVEGPSPAVFSLSGAGGEGNRPFYPTVPVQRFLKDRAKYIPDPANFEVLKGDILDNLDALSIGLDSGVDPLIVHYRHFRDRCHGGRSSQFHNIGSPLASALLRRAYALCPKEKSDRAQVLIDILLNGDADLALMPYDTEAKMPTAEAIADAFDGAAAIRAAPLDGRVFAGTPEPGTKASRSKLKMLARLKAEAIAHAPRVEEAELLPASYIAAALDAAEDAERKGDYEHPVKAVPVAHVILAGELLELSSQSAT